jgi:3-hydroxyacyl-[acyl-carrier-protein] dehydratase
VIRAWRLLCLVCRTAARVHFTDPIHVDPDAARADVRVFVDPDWEYLRDHFPGAPVLPGLVMLQMAVRAAAALLAEQTGAGPAELESLERLHVVRRVVPGETLTVVAAMNERTPDGTAARFTADGRVGDAIAMRARFRLRALDVWSTA